jgi:hypothetical protein
VVEVNDGRQIVAVKCRCGASVIQTVRRFDRDLREHICLLCAERQLKTLRVSASLRLLLLAHQVRTVEFDSKALIAIERDLLDFAEEVCRADGDRGDS